MIRWIYLVFILAAADAATTDTTVEKQLTQSQAWIFGFLSSIGLCVLGFLSGSFILIVQSCISVKAFKTVINILYALGCGAMIGDVMIHTLPQAFKHPDIKYEIVALLFIAAIVFFILVERCFLECGHDHSMWQFHKDHIQKKEGYTPSQKMIQERVEEEEERTEQEQEQKMTLSEHFESFHMSYKNVRQMLKKKKNLAEGGQKRKSTLKEIELKKNGDKEKTQGINNADTNEIKVVTNESVERVLVDMNEEKVQNIIHVKEEEPKLENKDEEEKGCIERLRGKGTAGYLNIITSFIHNIFDGFAIGAGFGARISTQYLPVLIAVYAHEVPREMGDVGIMMKNRFTGWQTVFFNSFTNITALIGTGIALGLGEIGSVQKYYVLSFASGNFVYIAADIWRHLFKNKNFWGNIFEFLSFCLGVGIEYLLILTESH